MDLTRSILKRFDDFYGERRQDRGGRSDPYVKRAKSPYDVLGLKEGTPFDEVKKRYRELVKKYHPDILMGRGESEEMIECSTRKLQEINEAYGYLKDKFGV